MRYRFIYIPYETKTREFDGKLLLISHLLNTKFTKIYFGSRSAIKKISLLNNKGIYILKSLSKTEENFYKKLKGRGYTLVLIHAEGGIHYKDNKSSILSFFDPLLLKYIDYNFVFGSAIKNDIIKYCGESFKDKTIVSGEPRFDLLKPELNKFYNNKINIIKKKYQKDIILINTNFSTANPIVGKDKIKSFFINEPTYTKETKKILLKRINTLTAVVDDYIKAIKKISKIFSDKQIIIRPHPSESEDKYHKSFNDYSNIYITKKGNVHEWILASDCMIHYDCTTGIEGLLANKPVISYLPKFDKDIVALLPINLSKKCYSANELINVLNDIYNDNYYNNISNSDMHVFEQTVHNVKKSSIKIIAHYFSDVLNKSYTKVSNVNRVKIILLDLVGSLKSIIKLLIVKNSSISKNKFGVLSKKEIKGKLKLLKKINKFNYKFKINKHDSFVEIRRK